MLRTTNEGVPNSGGTGASAGTKRRADESSLSDQERFAKRFNLLNLGAGPNHTNANSNYYIPVSKAPSQTTPTTSATLVPVFHASEDDECMQIDDTRDRVYIHNLDDELADIESDEEKLIFLPDIEKRLSKIPKQVLTGRKDDDHEGQELVLYSVPKSLTVAQNQDSVRKAILETRQRAREKAAEDARHQDMNCKYDQNQRVDLEAAETAHGYSVGYAMEQEQDPDAMDMD